jgi:hypothetical protein
MRMKWVGGALIAVAAVMTVAAPAEARWRGGHHGGYHRGGGGAVIGGLVAGALIGGAIASSQRGYYGPGYGSGYAPGYYAGPAGGDEVSYCLSRYKSYDPGSGTYLGYDGQRHPCP